MRFKIASLLAVALLSICSTSCGGTAKNPNSAFRTSSSTTATDDTLDTMASSTPPPGTYLKNDGDRDTDEGGHESKGVENDDGALLRAYNGETSQADKQAVTGLVKRYYAAATAGESEKVCSLLSSSLATALAEDQRQSDQKDGKSCAAVVSPMLEQQHRQLLSDEVATMVVIGVHVKGNLGLAVLGFSRTPESEILVEREGGTWKIDALFDTEMP